MKKYTISRENQRHIIVDPRVYAQIIIYARERGISLAEATYQLLRKAFATEEKLEE